MSPAVKIHRYLAEKEFVPTHPLCANTPPCLATLPSLHPPIQCAPQYRHMRLHGVRTRYTVTLLTRFSIFFLVWAWQATSEATGNASGGSSGYIMALLPVRYTPALIHSGSPWFELCEPKECIGHWPVAWILWILWTGLRTRDIIQKRWHILKGCFISAGLTNTSFSSVWC